MHEITSKLLPEPCRPQYAAYCPTMDLIATTTAKHNVDVWRFNGQRVFGLTSEGEEDGKGEVEGLAWRSDGQMLAVAYTDGTVRLINSFNGKVAHVLHTHSSSSNTLSSSQQQQSSPLRSEPVATLTSSLSWETHFSNAEFVRQNLDNASSSVALDDLLGPNSDVSRLLKVKANLPYELSAIDIEASLPKLSTLPATGVDDDIFSSRNSIDSIFHAQNAGAGGGHNKYHVVNVLLAGSAGPKLHIRIFDSFEIGSVDISHALPRGRTFKKIVRQTSHPLSSTQFLLVEAQDHAITSGNDATEPDLSYHIVGLDLRFISQTGRNLPLLATKATQLQNLLRYMSQIHIQLAQEIKAAFELPSRFLRNVNESLAEHDPDASFMTAAYHLVVTGDCDPRLKEWLVDEVGERGLKRWEKAVGDCLDIIRRMTSECLLPVLERCQVVVSRLDGLSKYSDTAARLGLDDKYIRSVRETIDVLTLLTEDLLRDVCTEIREFSAFMRWLKWAAEVEALEQDSERAEELRETYPGEAELHTVLQYIDGALKGSRVLNYISVSSSTNPVTTDEHKSDAGIYASYQKLRNSNATDKHLPELGYTLVALDTHCRDVFSRIAETLRKSVLSSYIAELPLEIDYSKVDVQVRSTEEDKTVFKIVVLAATKGKVNSIFQVMIDVQEESSKGSQRITQKFRKHELRVDATILDVEFIDDQGVLVLVSTPNDRQLLWSAINKGGQLSEWQTRHIFEQGYMSHGMRPSTLKVNGRKGRRAAAIFDEHGAGYVVLDVDSDVDEGSLDETDQTMTG